MSPPNWHGDTGAVVDACDVNVYEYHSSLSCVLPDNEMQHYSSTFFTSLVGADEKEVERLTNLSQYEWSAE